MERDISTTVRACRGSHVFSKYLKATRLKHRLSQEQLCANLKLKSRLFFNLDIITVSRWERGVNIPSLAKQAEIVGIYAQELVDVYSQDHHFLNESLDLLTLSHLTKRKSPQLYFCDEHDNYNIETIGVDHPRFAVILKMILHHEGNPNLDLYYPNDQLQQLSSLKIVIATVFDNQVIGHCLYLESTSHKIMPLLNFKPVPVDCDNEPREDVADTMLVLSSNGACTSIENYLMSVYINYFANNKQLKYLCWNISDAALQKKLVSVKLLPFNIKPLSADNRNTSVCSFLISRVQVMANLFLLKLAVISPGRRAQFLRLVNRGKAYSVMNVAATRSSDRHRA